MNRLFVDTSGWVALYNEDDKYHTAAVAFWRQLPLENPRFVTNDYIMDETYTNLRRARNGLFRARQAYETVERSRLVDLVEVDADYRQRGWILFTKYEDKVFSFTDCVCFAMMHELGIYQAFSFDADFARAGFVVRP